MKKVDLNCDMGESTSLWAYDLQHDLQLLPLITSMNLATGFHAGDPSTMHRLIDAAIEHQVQIGAHPSYADRANFGRSAMHVPPEELYDTILYQLGAMEAFLKLKGVRMHHVKPHGALYNQAAADPLIAQVIVDAVNDFDPALLLYVLSGSAFEKNAREKGLTTCAEVFADRRYSSGTKLTPRDHPGALIDDAEAAVAQLLNMILHAKVTDIDGIEHAIHAQTICIHSDHRGAKDLIKLIRNVFRTNDIQIQSF